MFRITHRQTHETRSRQTFSFTLRRKTSLHATSAVELIMYNVPDRASRTRRKRHREYSCGFSKMHYRRKNQQNGFTKGIDPFVKRFSLCCGLSSRTNSGYDCFHGLEQTHRFARRARDHARIYRGKYPVASIIDIERIRKKKKSHRGALDQSTSFVSQEVEETAGQFKEAEDAFERSLDAQQHTDTTTTT